MQERTISFTTAEVSAGGFLNHNQSIPFSQIDILRVKVSPSILGGTSQVQIYEKDTFLVADLIYGINPFVGNEFDPVQKDSAGVVSEAAKGFIVPYVDKDESRELHIKLVNNDAQAKTYAIDITYRLSNVFGVHDPVIEQLSVNDVNTRNYTLLAADINRGITVHTSVNGAGTVTTDTAAKIIRTCSLDNDGDTIKTYYINDGSQSLTLAGGVGVTIVNPRQRVASSGAVVLLFRRTSSAAVLVYIIGG